jgi:Cytokinin dehydrogenase 1, FAD and cytokinin binding
VQRTAADDGWEFFIDAAVYYTDTPPDDAAVTGGLRFDPARTVSENVTFLDWIDRLRPTVELLIQLGVWFLPHPWINLFLPASRTAAVVEPTLADLTPADTGMGPILLYPFRPGLVRRRFVQTPDEPGRVPVRDPAHDRATDRPGRAGRRQPRPVRAGPRGRRHALPGRLGAVQPARLGRPVRRRDETRP